MIDFLDRVAAIVEKLCDGDTHASAQVVTGGLRFVLERPSNLGMLGVRRTISWKGLEQENSLVMVSIMCAMMAQELEQTYDLAVNPVKGTA